MTEATPLSELGRLSEWDRVKNCLLQWKEMKRLPNAKSIKDILDARDQERHWTVLHHAAYDNQPEVVRLLLDAGADPLITCGRGREWFASSVGVSAYFASPDALKIFIESGIDIYLRSPLFKSQPGVGSTLLHRIMNQDPRERGTVKDQMGIIKVLVNVYDNPFCVDEHGSTPTDVSNRLEKTQCFQESFSLRERNELQKELERGPIAATKSRRRM